MAVILRLEGLNIDAGSGDIRRFFDGLHIPEGGVHIIGGKLGEAFIIFTSKSDGQLAIQRSGKPLAGSPVTLNISSFIELKQKIMLQLNKQKDAVAKDPMPQTAVKQSARQHDEHQIKGEEIGRSAYLRLYGLPTAANKQKVCHFLSGVAVMDVRMNVLQGRDQCCIVKVASVQEAEKGLKYSRRTLLGSSIQVRLAHERMWTSAVEERAKTQSPSSSEQERNSPDVHSFHNIAGKRRPKDWSVAGPPKRRCSEDRLHSGSPRHRHPGTVGFAAEYCIMVQNLPKNMTKTEIRALFSCPDIPNNKIIHLLNKWRERTSTAFIMFSHPEDYAMALNMDGSVFGTKHIHVSSITKEKMRLMFQKNSFYVAKSPLSETALSWIYARNFPADVKKAEVRDFFGAYGVREWDITLLEDDRGHGIGEAVVQLMCEQRAQDTHHALNGRLFMGVKILLRCVSLQQTKDILLKAR